MTNNNRRNVGDRSVAKTVHWRRVKNVGSKILKRCNGDIANYDSENICCYTSTGAELNGYNVSYKGLDSGASCFVYDNRYTVFEFPSKENISSYEGNFFVLAQNKDFDYWIATSMEYKIDYKATAETGVLKDSVTFRPLGQYDVRIQNEQSSAVDVSLSRKASELNYDYSKPKFSNFDTANNRKSAYHTSPAQIVAGIKHQPYSKNSIVGGKSVKKYHSNKSKKKGKK